eukprot:CAMPEP_0184544194 /NCGR_PEP_ID=MMETSP0199_2-20130426/3456_1 /TAXON_ID=1112570 /ORGANISM="Thraustochytrium sp., Strain LLF1b" /LENGTH=285 /DNA_ID=CAMNT_0026938337 /DNA_START=255 /DNA_END=1112 /DNA_ORIENTATION=-
MAGLRRPREWKEDMVGTHSVHSMIKYLLLFGFFPMALLTAAFKLLPMFVLYTFGCLTLAMMMIRNNNERQQTSEVFVAIPLEKAADKAQYKLRLELLKGMSGDVLDLSPASGLSLFRYYIAPKNKISSVLTFEENKKLHPLINKRAKHLSDLFDLKVSLGSCSSVDEILPNLRKEGRKFDCVVLNHFLGRAADMDAAIQQLKDVLKPEGTVVFIEQSAMPETIFKSTLDVLNAVYRTLTGGFCVNRNIPTGLSKGGFKVEHSDLGVLPLPGTSLSVGYASPSKNI